MTKRRPPASSARTPRSHEPTSSAAKPSQLTPDLRARFHRLLLTWPDQSRHRRVPWRELSRRLEKEWADRENVFVEFEERFGSGHYDDRKRFLDATLDSLADDPHVDLPAVLEALWEARHARVALMREGREIDLRRMLKEHRRLTKALQHQLLQTEESYLTLLDYAGPGRSEPLDQLLTFEHWLDLLETLRLLRRALNHDPSRKVDTTGRDRREKPGRQSAPWLVRLREHIRRAGVDDPEDTLLIAAGLLPYRPILTR